MSATGHATVTTTPGRLPLFSAGKVTALACADFVSAMRHYFSVKDIAEDKQVAQALGCFAEPKIKNWLRPSPMHKKLTAMSFDEFMTTFRAKFLPHDWVEKTRKEVLSSRQGTSQSFDDWATHVISLAALLKDDATAANASALTIDDIRLRHTLEAGMLEDLSHRLTGSDASKVLDDHFDDWLSAVTALDEERAYDDKKLARLMANAAAKGADYSTGVKRKAAPSSTDERVAKRPFTDSRKGNHPNAPSTTASSSSAPAFVSLPTLSDIERRLLNENSGCTKCRRVFVDHRSAACPNGFPDGAKYKPLTQTDVDAANAARKGKGKATVAVVMPDIEDDDDSSDDPEDADEP